MNRHQVLTGAANAGDHCYSVGSVEGVPFTAYASGCNIVILASNFQRVQIIPGLIHGNIQVGCLDSSTDVGKIAAAYGKEVCIYEPTPLLHQSSNHRLDYQWVQTAVIKTEYQVQVLSWNLSGTRLLSGGESIQLWQLSVACGDEDVIEEEPSNIQVKCTAEDGVVTDIDEQCKWNCVWSCKTAQPVSFLKFSPDGTLFATAGKSDRLVKIWYSSKIVTFSSQRHNKGSGDVSFTFIYIAHPRAVTGLSWRKTSKFMPKDSVANMLVTSCRDNICRIWVQTLIPEDGLVDLQQIEAIANQNLRVQTQRHRRKIMQRLKHMKSFNQFRKHQASQFTEDPHEPIAVLPSTYSVHDFHSFGIQGSGITPSLHFHLAGSINAESDIPLVPRLSGTRTKEPNFVVHWLNNKEMSFTHAAEHLLQEVSDKVLHLQNKKEINSVEMDAENADNENKQNTGSKRKSSQPKSDSHENINDIPSSKMSSSASSSTSIATDTSNSQTQSCSGDFIDRKIEKLLREWHRSPDLLFSVYPIDGSFLVWLVDWLDEYNPGSFRQAQVSFASRIPNAIPLGDAATMSHHMFMYSPHAGLDLRLAISASSSEQIIKDKVEKNENPVAHSSLDYGQFKAYNSHSRKTMSQYCALSSTTPTVCMMTKHSNGSLNLWHLSFADNSQYTQVLSIGHSTRVCGHRFRINDITCHPVLPLLLTTSHHNLPDKDQNLSGTSSPTVPTSPCCCVSLPMGLQSGFCSELILWKVDPVGPLSKSGGVTELARINSLATAAFANVAWIPTLLPSTTQGSISNSPSACFVASDGLQLRIYQAVIDARTLLAEISSSSRRDNLQDMSQSSSTSSGLGYRHSTLQDTFKIVSEQSTSRPGCVIELDSIMDAHHDWQNTQLLHVYQEQLIYSSPQPKHKRDTSNISLVQPDLQAIVDLRNSSVFEEPFYLVILEKQEEKSILHMWKITIASPFGAEDQEHGSFAYVADSNLVQSDHSNQSSRSQTPEPTQDASFPLTQVSPLRITTVKVCTQTLPLPEDVEIVHATPAAGHLSSSNIYPACFAPYLICTACSDYYVRFWKCEVSENENKEVEFRWVEWEMMLNKSSSAVHVPGQPLYVSCAYSGRMACAFKHGKSFTRHNSQNPDSRYVNIGVSIFECESTGGSEWILEDTINLRNISLPLPKLSLNLESLFDASERNKRTADALMQKLSSDETVNERLPLQRLLSVPSYATLQTLRQAISEKGNQDLLAPKSIVHLDWVSAEDGSHILTVAIGSKILLFAPVSNDIAQSNVQAMKASKSASRPLLKQASSMVLPLSCNDEIRWMRIRSTPLQSADSLPPIPMQLSWVRHGILVVGMDSEMHIYSQWRVPPVSDKIQNTESEKDEPLVDDRKLTEEELLSHAQESSNLRLPTATGTLSRSTSTSVLSAAVETKKKKTEHSKQQPQRDSVGSVGPMPDFGLFEASRLACPVLPQYHPKQLMELLGFGKLRRVKAILSHLVRCLSGTENIKKTYLQLPESTGGESEEGSRSWSRSRALSLAASTSPLPHSPNDQRGSVSVFPEEVTLDYVEIQSIPPLPLFTLLATDKESHTQPSPTNLEDQTLDADYSGLFDVSTNVEDNLDDILHNKSVSVESKKERPSFSSTEKKINLANFSTNQAALLTRFLTHSHLPGLSSLDQMHLLALADTVASFNTSVADRFGAEPAISKENTKSNVEGLNVTVTTDSLDACGLRFLLAMRHFTYLLRCLPLGQRAQLQNLGLGSHSLVWAFHSETQEELLQLVPCSQKGNLKWSELRELGVGWWIRSNTVLRRLIEKVAKAAFQRKNDPMDAALYYLAMKKKTLLWGLFRSVQDNKMTAFFQNNFALDKWRKSAQKNAYVLMGKQRFEHAAAFFLLGGDLKVAVEIILSKLNDIQLAMVVIRLHEGEMETVPPSLRRLLFLEILGCDEDGSNYIPSKAYPDPFIRCMARWILQDYCGSLTTLLQTDVGYSHPRAAEMENLQDRMSANPSVFNFYLFLRTHPLVVRRQRAQNLSEIKKSKALTRQESQSESSDIVDMPFEDTITPLERRLFFTTAHAHFRAGCPALALEVLSRLPNRVLTEGPMSPDDAVFDFANVLTNEDESIATGRLALDAKVTSDTATVKSSDIDWGQPVSTKVEGGSASDFDWSQPVASKVEDSSGFDWGAPVLSQTQMPELELDLNLNNSESEGSEDGIQIKTTDAPKEELKSIEPKSVTIDIMAQQLKFIACLKIMMEELSTLATGYEVDGGQLRYQLYIWLEKSVSALKDLCHYGCTSSQEYNNAVPSESMAVEGSPPNSGHWDSAIDFQNQKASLHEILLADKMDFEAKLQRASRRKQWLKANEALLRTLLSYCSLHGAHGGGLAAVRMELILLLHELQQERSRQQLLSPLPFPTTLPLLAASVACQKTVVADPIRHLQSLVHDILLTIIDMTEPPAVTGSSYSQLIVLRDLSTSLSACIYESLCDSDNFVVKQGGARGLSMEELISSGVVYQNSHLLAGHVGRQRHNSSSEEEIKVTTSPHKWPGVSSLRALLAQDKDEDSPKLHTLLCEAFVSVYLSQLIHALSSCDCHVLYRLVGQQFSKDTWSLLFGGGVKVLLHVSTGSSLETSVSPNVEKENASESSSGILDSLSRQRIKIHMKLLGQLGQQTSQPIIKEDKPTYREQFVPPKMSMVSLFMSKAELPPEWQALDYDSNASLPSDEEDEMEEETEMDDVFGESTEKTQSGGGRNKIISDSGGLEQLDPSSYTWGILRYAVVKIAMKHIVSFVNVAGLELQELPVVSPLIHAVIKCMDLWMKDLKQFMDAFEGPPPNYIPGCFISTNQTGPPALKYASLLELYNTPFRSNHRAALPVKRLWNYLVRQEHVQDIFIRYIFCKKPHIKQIHDQDPEASENNPNTSTVRIIHKDQEAINTFCLNRVKNGIIALASSKEIQELDVSVLLQPVPWLEAEAEFDALNMLKPADTLPSTDYLVIQHPMDAATTHSTGSTPTGSGPTSISTHSSKNMKGLNFPGCTNPQFCQLVLERSRHMLKPLKKHKIDGIRKLTSHPLMPVYLSGSQDGSVRIWEWNHAQPISSPRQAGTFAKVTRILFNLQGNKFGVTDGDGVISLWQVGLGTSTNKPFFSTQCHTKQANDFAFLSSSSLIATAGQSTDNRNVCLWDTLLPQGKSLIASFQCHENGCSSLLYASQNHILISAGKKGDICIFDVRQRQLRHKFQAHDSPIKCLALDPGEEFFATGSADGDIKVWGLSVHVKLCSFAGEHTKSSLFRSISNGVSQLEIDEYGRLFSCGADGSLKVRTLPDQDIVAVL